MASRYVCFLIIPFITACHSLSISKSQKKSEVLIDSTYLQSKADWHYIKGESQSYQNFSEESIDSFKEALIYSPDSFSLNFRLLKAYMQAGLHLKAFKQCKALLKKYPNKEELHFKLAEIYRKNLLYKKALAKYLQILSKNPTNKEALSQQASLYVEMQEYSSARKTLRTLASQKSDNLYRTHYFLAQIHRKEKHFKQAQTHYLKARKLRPDFTEAVLELASLYRRAGKEDKAISLLKAQQKTQGYHPQIQQALFGIYIEKGRWSEALNYLEPIAQAHPEDQLIQSQLAWLWSQQKDLQKASAILEKLMKSKKAQLGVSTYALYAGLLEESGDLPKALNVLSQASSLFPKDTDILFYQAFIHDRLGQIDQAIKGMKQVLKINTQHVQALNHLAFVYAEQSEQLEEAEQMALKALSLKPNDSYVLDTTGWVLFKRGKTKEALKYLQLAYQNNTSEVVIVEHLAEVYYHLNIIDKSIALYKKAIGLETNENKKRKLEEKLLLVQSAV